MYEYTHIVDEFESDVGFLQLEPQPLVPAQCLCKSTTIAIKGFGLIASRLSNRRLVCHNCS